MGSAPAILHKILALWALLRQLFIKFWLCGLCSDNSSRVLLYTSFDLLLSRCHDGSVAQCANLASEVDLMMKIDTFDTNFKSNSSSIGNAERSVCWALNSHPAYTNGFAGH